MQKGKVDLAKYQDIIEIIKERDDNHLAGAHGFCFVEGKKMIKIYREPKYNVSDDLTEYYSPHIAFPIFYIKKNGMIYGEVMPYFKTKTLDNALNDKININSLIVNYQDIINEMREFSDICMYDIGYVKNILYSPSKGFYLVDTTPWKQREYSHDYNVHYFNSAILYTIMNYSFECSSLFDVLDIIRNGFLMLKNSLMGQEFIHLMLANTDGKYHLIELLDAYKSVIKEYYHVDVETLGDIKKYTKIMKNS